MRTTYSRKVVSVVEHIINDVDFNARSRASAGKQGE